MSLSLFSTVSHCLRTLFCVRQKLRVSKKDLSRQQGQELTYRGRSEIEAIPFPRAGEPDSNVGKHPDLFKILFCLKLSLFWWIFIRWGFSRTSSFKMCRVSKHFMRNMIIRVLHTMSVHSRICKTADFLSGNLPSKSKRIQFLCVLQFKDPDTLQRLPCFQAIGYHISIQTLLSTISTCYLRN